MSDIFMKSNPQLDAAIAECTDPAKISAIIKAHLDSAGVLAPHERGDDYGVRLLRPMPTQAEGVPLSASTSNFKYEKEIRFAESTGKRTLVIRANTKEDLDALENQVVGQ